MQCRLDYVLDITYLRQDLLPEDNADLNSEEEIKDQHGYADQKFVPLTNKHSDSTQCSTQTARSRVQHANLRSLGS